jgi:tRNA modification GTPase
MDRTGIIVAIATAPLPAAIGIVRLSGPGTHDLVRRLVREPEALVVDRVLRVAWLCHPGTGRALDQAMVVLFPPVSAFTGEESAELHCHGGPAVMRAVLDACTAAGARPAGPGEFTRRALAAGRLDLVQAEAVALIADARTEGAVAVGLRALGGGPSAAIESARSDLLELLADCEASLDFTEDDPDRDLDRSAVAADLEALARRMEDWIRAADAAGPAIRGFRVALAGRPNAGKSSLFNALLGRPRSIVHEEAGTTRDVVGETLTLQGATVTLLDTAGLREAGGAVEAEGVRRAVQAAEAADCIVLVVDGTDPGPPIETRADIVAWHKADLWEGDPLPATGAESVRTSAVDGRGVDWLRDRLAARAAAVLVQAKAADVVIAGERQREALAGARDRVLEALDGLRREEVPVEVVAADLRAAVELLGGITGRAVTEEVLDRVFARFCVGK